MLAKIFSRKSTKGSCRNREIKPLKPEDFDDIFGGPPRCVFSRQSSVEFHPSDYLMFHNPVRHSVDKNGLDLPEFKISSTSQVFCSEEFDEIRRSNLDTTSVLTSDEFIPPKSDGHVYSPFYAFNLRPINEQPTWNASTILMHGVQQTHQDKPDLPYSRPPFVGDQFTDTEQQTDCTSESHDWDEDDGDDDDDDDKNEMSRSYVFGINYIYREGSDEGVRVDEAIAWAKESYQSHTSSAEMTDGRVDGGKSLHRKEEYPIQKKTEKDEREVDESREMELLEEDIKLWSSGKERNIELLLSTLQDILWPNSGWCPISRRSLYESSNLKKAYQKARLCLHPDKLQQRGATFLHKYIAERIFLILQEAWDAYISQDIIVPTRG